MVLLRYLLVQILFLEPFLPFCYSSCQLLRGREVDWIHLAQDRCQLNLVMNVQYL